MQLLAVPTPVRDGTPDLTYLREAVDAVKKGIHKDLLIVIESTIPPGTTINVVKPMFKEIGVKAAATSNLVISAMRCGALSSPNSPST